jgi:DNA helicase-2/ATP-dependent DNA helicase PcrA
MVEAPKTDTVKPTAPQQSQSSPTDAPLFEELRAVRRQLAAGKPAFTVLPDSVLHAIAAARPTSLDQLTAIKGIGPAKLQQYGAAFLAAVAATRH